jgi:hypothetical protein
MLKMFRFSVLLILAIATGVKSLAPSGPWDEFNFAPKTRTVYATSIRHVEPTVSGSDNLLLPTGGSATLEGEGAWVTLDFGKEVDLQTPLIQESYP